MIFTTFSITFNITCTLELTKKSLESLLFSKIIKPNGLYRRYEFNNLTCKEIGDRILCGYDKNKGDILEYNVFDLGNGCRIRRDRIECGYIRKLIRQKILRKDEKYMNENLETTDKDDRQTQTNVLKSIYMNMNETNVQTKCFEIDNRIVCMIVKLVSPESPEV